MQKPIGVFTETSCLSVNSSVSVLFLVTKITSKLGTERNEKKGNHISSVFYKVPWQPRITYYIQGCQLHGMFLLVKPPAGWSGTGILLSSAVSDNLLPFVTVAGPNTDILAVGMELSHCCGHGVISLSLSTDASHPLPRPWLMDLPTKNLKPYIDLWVAKVMILSFLPWISVANSSSELHQGWQSI